MDAARKRDRAHVMLTAQAVWHGTHLDGGALKDWCAGLLGESTLLPEAALIGMLTKNSRGLKTVSWAEALIERPNGTFE